MKKIFHKALLLFLVAFFSNSMYGQAKDDNLINNEMTFELKNDTLYSSTGLKLFPGQKLITGNAAGEEGQFRSIISNKAAIVPSIWGQDKRFENAIENYVDSKKNRERLSKSLIAGSSLIIKGIGLSKTGKPHFYMVSLSSGSEGCKADIRLALVLRELLLQP